MEQHFYWLTNIEMTCILLVFQFVRNLGTFLFMKKEQPFSEKRKRQKRIKSPPHPPTSICTRLSSLSFLFVEKNNLFLKREKDRKNPPDQQAYVLACRPCPFYDLFTLPRRFWKKSYRFNLFSLLNLSTGFGPLKFFVWIWMDFRLIFEKSPENGSKNLFQCIQGGPGLMYAQKPARFSDA